MRRFGKFTLGGVLVLTLALTLLLAGCGQQAEVPAATPEGFVVANIGIESGHLSAQLLDAIDLEPTDLEPQGSPFSPNGDVAVGLLEVSVFDRNDDQVTFNALGSGYQADENGTVTTIMLTPANESAALTLAASGNPYTFVAHGRTQQSDPSVIAYDSQTKIVGSSSTVRLSLTSVLGGALLVPRYPASHTSPSSTPFELLLVVLANGHADFPSSSYLQVPLGDFSVQHGTVTGATVLDSSDRGLRLDINACQVGVAAGEVTGLVWNGSQVVAGAVTVPPYNVGCPTAGGNVEVDLQAPTVSISYDSGSQTVTGLAADGNDRIAKVQVWDGATLMASTDPVEAVGSVAYFQFDLGLNSFSVVLNSEPVGGLIALAFDPAGNEGRSAETATLSHVWVAANAGLGGDGSEASPFNTIQAGINAVEVGGTVWVKPGSYTENVTITKNLKLLSSGGRAVTTIEGVASGSELGTVVISGGTTAAQLGEVDHGFHFVGIDGPPAIEKAAVYFQGAHSGAAVIGNEIEANGDAGLTTEYNRAVDRLVVSHNTFSGRTFTGANPGGEGFGNQFSEANVPRQLVVISTGASYATFSNNLITGTTGGVNSSSAPQGNTMVTVDALGSLIADNHFEGYTSRYATSLRARGAGSTITGNSFVSATLPDSVGHLYLNDVSLDEALVNANSFDRGVWVADSTGGTIGLSLPSVFPASGSNRVVNVLSGEYSVLGHIEVNAAGLTLRGPNAGVAQGDARQLEAVINSGVAISAPNVTVEGFALEGFGNHLGDISAIYLADGATGTTISSNVVTGVARQGRGVVNALAATADARIVNNTFDNLTSGTFAQGSAIFWVEGNLFTNNAAGSSNDATGGTITANTFAANEEGIGLGAAGVTITSNSFETGHDSYITDYVGGGSYDLSDLISDNSFDTAPSVGEYHPGWSANPFPAVVP